MKKERATDGAMHDYCTTSYINAHGALIVYSQLPAPHLALDQPECAHPMPVTVGRVPRVLGPHSRRKPPQSADPRHSKVEPASTGDGTPAGIVLGVDDTEGSGCERVGPADEYCLGERAELRPPAVAAAPDEDNDRRGCASSSELLELLEDNSLVAAGERLAADGRAAETKQQTTHKHHIAMQEMTG